MSHDLQLARRSTGFTNLAIGEPIFLQETMEWHRIPTDYWADFSPLYPGLGGNEVLLNKLRERHSDAHIVVANGAKQAIAATFYAYRMLGKKSVHHKAPYWPSYPTLAKSAQLRFLKKPNDTSVIVTTAPNNPDGTYGGPKKCHIWDAVYASEVYGWRWSERPDYEVAIYSAAKMYGLSGLRIGWLATDNKEIADAAAYFVEITTSGVCSVAQGHLAAVMDLEEEASESGAKTQARIKLLTNGKSYSELLGPLLDKCEGFPANGQGMFAWVKPRDYEKFTKAVEMAKVQFVTGEACGIPGWYRCSVGQNVEATSNALNRIVQAYSAL